MPDYGKSKIYQIKNTINDEIYIGSTCAPLAFRMSKHRHHSKTQETPLYISFREHGVDKFYIELIEEYPCNSKQELLAREGYYIKKCGTLNKHIAGRTKKEWEQDNKDIIYAQQKERYFKNLDERRAYRKAYYHAHREDAIDKTREWYIANKERVIEQKAEQGKTLIKCECGATLTSWGMKGVRHSKSKRHLEAMAQKSEFKKISANGNDLIYVSNNLVQTEGENIDEDNSLKEDSA